MFCWFNGEIMPYEMVSLKINDLAILRGYGMFDYFRTYQGKPFKWDWYWERFSNSAAKMGLDLPMSQAQTADVLTELYQLSRQPDVAFRFVATGGYSPDSVAMATPNFAILVENLPKDNPQAYKNGLKVIPYEFVRFMPEVKTTNYFQMVLMAKELKAQNAQDLLFHQRGEISELTRSNFFIFKGDTLITSGTNILHGITRRVMLELAKSHFKVEIRPLMMAELETASEAFTTSTTKWAMPVTQVGDLTIGNGKPGKRTQLLHSLFESSTVG